MEINLDRDRTTPLYRQIVAQVIARIEDGSLPVGTLLPPERKLAARLNVNRTTVVTAYRDLVATGMVEARVGRGTWVSDTMADGANPPQPLAWQTLFSATTERMRDPALRDMLAAMRQPGTIAFGTGAPAPEFFPVDRFRQAMDEALDHYGPDLFVYGPVQGSLPLREALVAWMARGGIRTAAEQIVVLHGSQQGLDLIARVLLEPGDAVVVESPTYLGALSVFRGAGVRLLPVALDGDGMRMDLLEQILARHRPKFIYTLPTFQNPTGVTMSLARRHALLAVAARYGVPIVEDDPYGELAYGDDPPPRLAALDRRGLVIYLSTMSKVFLPGLRLGWLAAPQTVAEAVTLARQSMDVHPNSAMQHILQTFLVRGWLAEHVADLRPIYQARRDAMFAALERMAPPGMTWSEPTGGYFIWCRLPGGMRARTLAVDAAREGVSFVVGESFSPNGGERDAIRLNFTGASPEEIAEGIRRLMVAIRRLGRRDTTPTRDDASTGPRPIV
ncbi:MAG: PLP-dependent aminotransferase family protein [Chloroflexota bacterium]|nr:PLP-dependent aminotransferase family protein [Chloroflexota bacterium]